MTHHSFDVLIWEKYISVIEISMKFKMEGKFLWKGLITECFMLIYEHP